MKRLILIFVFTSFAFAQKYQLNLKLKPGKSYIYLSSTETRTTQTFMGSEQTMESLNEEKVKLEVMGAKNGEFEIVISIDTLRTKIHSPMLDTTFVFPINFAVKRVVNKYGEVLKTEIIRSEKKSVTGSGLSKAGTFIVKFPKGEIEVGQSWSFTQSDSVENPRGKFKTSGKGKYTFESVEEKLGIRCAKLRVDSKFNISGSGVTQGMNYGMEGEGRLRGYVWVSLDTGLLVYSETSMEMDMAMAFAGQMAMSVPMTQKIETRVSLLR